MPLSAASIASRGTLSPWSIVTAFVATSTLTLETPGIAPRAFLIVPAHPSHVILGAVNLVSMKLTVEKAYHFEIGMHSVQS
jgi:hypothetical protein